MRLRSCLAADPLMSVLLPFGFLDVAVLRFALESHRETATGGDVLVRRFCLFCRLLLSRDAMLRRCTGQGTFILHCSLNPTLRFLLRHIPSKQNGPDKGRSRCLFSEESERHVSRINCIAFSHLWQPFSWVRSSASQQSKWRRVRCGAGFSKEERSHPTTGTSRCIRSLPPAVLPMR